MFEYILSASDMSDIYNGWISDPDKVQRLANSDGTSPDKVIKDIIAGMIGECGAYYWVSRFYKCQLPEFGIIKRDAKIWEKDLMPLEDVRIRTASGTTKTLLRSISCKAQFRSITCSIRDTKPSWLFQMKTEDRFADPMLSDPHCNKLLIVNWIDDRWESGRVLQRNPRKAYKQGFRWKPQMTCFWWPEVFPYLNEPRMKHLHGKKKALYYAEIKHLQAELLSP